MPDGVVDQLVEDERDADGSLRGEHDAGTADLDVGDAAPPGARQLRHPERHFLEVDVVHLRLSHDLVDSGHRLDVGDGAAHGVLDGTARWPLQLHPQQARHRLQAVAHAVVDLAHHGGDELGAALGLFQ